MLQKMFPVIRRFSSRKLGARALGYLISKQQTYLFRKTVKHAYTHSPFYRSRFNQLGIKPADVKNIEDLARLGFFTLPQDVQTDPFQFLAVPRAEILYMMSTTGTTGKRKVVFYSKTDMSKLVETQVLGLLFSGVRKEDVAQICFCYGEPFWLVGPTVERSLEEVGCFIIPSGNKGGIEDQIELMSTYGTTLLLGTPSYIHRLTVEGSKLLDLQSLKVRMISLGAEPFPESLRKYLETAWDARVLDSYGLTEMGYLVAGECFKQHGLHTVTDLIIEIVDPETGELVEEGEDGELVFTTLSRRGMPLIRYRSGDISHLLEDDICECTVPTRKIARIRGRVDDMTFLGTGENVFPYQFDQALFHFEDVLDYQLIISKEGYKDTLHFRVETNSPSTTLKLRMIERLEKLLPTLHYDIHSSKTITEPTLEFVKPGELIRHNPIKAKRVIDKRG